LVFDDIDDAPMRAKRLFKMMGRKRPYGLVYFPIGNIRCDDGLRIVAKVRERTRDFSHTGPSIMITAERQKPEHVIAAKRVAVTTTFSNLSIAQTLNGKIEHVFRTAVFPTKPRFGRRFCTALSAGT